MKRALLLFFTVAIWAQQPAGDSALLNNKDLLELYGRANQLMESTGFAVPDLARAGAPLIEHATQGLTSIRSDPANVELNYAFLVNLRAYIQLADSVPKPFPFPEPAQRQFGEMRDVLTRAESHFRALLARKDQLLRNPDPDNLGRYAEVDAHIAAPKPDRPRIVFLGDSITDFWRLNEYFPDRDVVNRGISGQTTGQMLGRVQSDVMKLRPSALLVLGGTNDIARGISLAAVEDNLTMIADLADFRGIKVILAAVLPVSDYQQDVDPSYARTHLRPPGTIKSLNSWIQSFCAQRKFQYLDYYSPMVDASGFLPADLSDDGLHPNSKGYRVMAPLALKAIDSTLKPTSQPPQKKHRLFLR
jgi:lysophospholipase L1-like esterase